MDAVVDTTDEILWSMVPTYFEKDVAKKVTHLQGNIATRIEISKYQLNIVV